jgi:hypothetical protein
MSEQYRLVFAGEVVEGQHPAVVKKRLAAVLKLDDERMDTLFSGKSVVVKKVTDKQNAARYQQVFEKAGARLRVLPQAPAVASDSAADDASPSSDEPAAQAAPAAGSLDVLPVGTDLLDASERTPFVETDIDTSHLSVQGAVFNVDDVGEDTPTAPNVDHLTLAELGAMLGTGTPDKVVVEEITVDFSLAEVGAVLDDLPKPPAPPAPDTSHLSVQDQDPTETNSSAKDPT